MNLEEYFEGITIQSIDAFIKSGQEEHLSLEFKTISSADLSNRDDRRNFAKALSGFANSDGGIVIWGVDARRRKSDDADVAIAKQEIVSLSVFLSKLGEFTGQFVRPLVDGVRHRAIETDADNGFAATLVPESDLGPHMALGGEGRYFKRSGANFYQMEHFDVADMFGRRKRPRLLLTADVSVEGTLGGGGERPTRNAKITLSLLNSGRGSAKSAYLALKIASPYSIDYYGLDGNRNEGMTRLHALAGESRYAASPGIVLHPQMSLGVTAIRFKYRVGDPPPDDLRIEYLTATEDVSLEPNSLTLTGEAILGSMQSS